MGSPSRNCLTSEPHWTNLSSPTTRIRIPQHTGWSGLVVLKGPRRRDVQIMGRSYLFECGKCGYRAAVTGGRAEGRALKVQSIRCRDCRAVYDCVLALRSTINKPLQNPFTELPEELRPTVMQAINRLPAPGPTSWEWTQFELSCPEDSTHQIEPWKRPWRCPRCGAYMDRSALPHRLWE